MSDRTNYGEVKLKVRRTALVLKEFTVDQLVRDTGLNPNSIRTEIQRLRKKGFITSERVPGQRAAKYRLSEDPEKRLELSRSIEEFYPESPKPVLELPTSRLYEAAVEILDRAESVEGKEREDLLRQAEIQIEGAWQTEGASQAPELVKAHLLRERGRLACLQRRTDKAQEFLEEAREKFAAMSLESDVQRVDAYLVYLELRRRLSTFDVLDTDRQVQCILAVLESNRELFGPWSGLLIGVLDALAQSTEKRVVRHVMHSPSPSSEEVTLSWPKEGSVGQMMPEFQLTRSSTERKRVLQVLSQDSIFHRRSRKCDD